MFNLFKTARENARKAAEYDKVVAERRTLGRALSEARADIDLLLTENRRLSEIEYRFDRMTAGLAKGSAASAEKRKLAASRKIATVEVSA